MKKQKDLAKLALEFAIELSKMRVLFPEEERSGVLMEMRTDAVSAAACISTALKLDYYEVKNDFLPQAYSGTFRIEVLLEVSLALGWLDSIDEPMRRLRKIRSGVKKMIREFKDECPY
jgi:hypothetical protein